MKLSDVIANLESIAPPQFASDGDNIGLQVGDRNVDIGRIGVALDPTPDVVDAAIDFKADLLVCHHPLIYSPIRNVAHGEPVQDRIVKLISSDVALYVMHTNYDAAPGGVNDVLAERIGVHVSGVLTFTYRERLYKIAVFAPAESVDAVRDAMAEAGAGSIGNYTHASFRSPGTGTFQPLPDANPYIGDIGVLAEVDEFRLEMIVPQRNLPQVLDAMLYSHPYEEVAYDVYALENPQTEVGIGRIGSLDSAMRLRDFRAQVENRLGAHNTRTVGDPDQMVQKVAIASGSGRHNVKDAIASGANVLVTGEIGYHDLLDAEAVGLAVIAAGHYETEFPAMEALSLRLEHCYKDYSVVVKLLPQDRHP